MSYWRFAAMIATSTVVMFGLMYLNTYAWEHVFFSETRVYMALVMGAAMAAIMLAFMLSMYADWRINAAIFAGSLLVFAGALWLVRSQATVSQTSYLRAMIPHHSIAIMTSERAQITDPRVRKLADEIIEAQNREISEMHYLIGHLTREGSDIRHPIYKDRHDPDIVSVDEALRRVRLEMLDPSPMSGAEADKALRPAPQCRFSRVIGADPILVARAGESGPAQAVMKLNGALVALRSTGTGGFPALSSGGIFSADGARMTVVPLKEGEGERVGDERRWPADLVFELAQGLKIGYRGYYACDALAPKAAD